ncbi:uncharacterized protein [Aegilops tauschii subsp. strangulata]|uniref:uncharacterized protein isoform X2 n=1 Tax=Aegilops tauschii subsp. strangulata TaxID=200361 RepID=UPI003CC89F3D
MAAPAPAFFLAPDAAARLLSGECGGATAVEVAVGWSPASSPLRSPWRSAASNLLDGALNPRQPISSSHGHGHGEPTRCAAAGLGWCSGCKNTLGKAESGLLGRHPRPSSAATSSTKAPSLSMTPLPSSMHTQVKLAVTMKMLYFIHVSSWAPRRRSRENHRLLAHWIIDF